MPIKVALNIGIYITPVFLCLMPVMAFPEGMYDISLLWRKGDVSDSKSLSCL